MWSRTVAIALPFFTEEQSSIDVLAEMGIMPISRSQVRKHKRQVVRDDCTPRQLWHRKAGLVAMSTCLIMFIVTMVMAQFTVLVVYQGWLANAAIVSFVGICYAWMYRDIFSPGKWHRFEFGAYANPDRVLPDDVSKAAQQLYCSFPKALQRVHRYGEDPLLSLEISFGPWDMFTREIFLFEFDDNGIV